MVAARSRGCGKNRGIHCRGLSCTYAAAVVKKIIGTTRYLANFPFYGRIVPEFDDETVRENLVYSYRVIYRIRDKTVTIATVLHGRRDLGPSLDR